jgi:hypothetical protein
MSDLAEFLLARIAEDELWASQASPWATGSRDEGQPIAWKRHVWNWSPMRVLDECDAKRRIVEEHAGGGGSICSVCADGMWNLERASLPCQTLRLLALPYADHPDYREEWKP